MGRELKRVALDFDHPLGKVWAGFVNPYQKPCPACQGHGTTSARQRLDDLVRLLLLSGSDSLLWRNHPYFERMKDFLTSPLVPSSDMAELTGALSRPLGQGRLFGHDALDRYLAVEKIIRSAGLDPDTWGKCPACQGTGIDAALLAQYQAWQPTEPPAGPGFQVWETVSEGSPVSPVFGSEDALIAWLLDQGYSEGAAEQFVARGSAPTGVLIQRANGQSQLYRDIDSLNAALPDEDTGSAF